VTLTALGGMGKTRVALATATALDAVLEGGSWFVDLAEAEHADQIRPQIAAQLGLKGHDSQALESILESSERLVILDNMEQIAGAGADVVQALVRACPSTWFLVTSRLPLGLDDEEVFRLAPLSTTASIELLTERNPALQRADPTLLDALAEALEGSPLAIELAAAQTRTVPAADVLAQIRTHFDAVEDGAGIHPDRHRSLRACLDGSWELLNPSEQQTLAQLSIFVGGFTMEAAEAVVRVDHSWVHDTLAFLVDCSLLHADRSGRFRMLPSTVAYAREHLPVPIRMDVRHRHLAYFAQMGTADALARLDQRGGFPLLERLQEDLDNLLLAASHARAQDAFDLAVDVSLAAAAVLRLRGPHAKAVELLVHVQTVQPVAQRARLFTTLARFGFLAGNAADGARHAALGLQAARATDDPDRVAASLLQVAEGLRTRNELSRAKSAYKEVLTLVPRCRSRLVEAVALEGLASIQHRRGRPEAARSLYNRAVHLYDQRGAEHVRGFALVALCVHLVEVGELERADRLFRRALRSSERTGHRRVYLRALGGLALIADYRGDLETAATMYQRATRESRSFGMARTEASNLLNLGSVYVVQGETRKALKALGETREVLARVGNPDDLDSIALYWLACSCFDRGQFGEAVTHLEEICTRKERSQEPRWNGAARLLLGRVALYAQDPIAARTHLQAADPLVRAANDPALVVQLLLVRAHLCRATRDLTKAEQLLERAGQVPMVAQQPWLAGWSDLERAQICMANAQIAEGVSAAEQAYAHSNDAGYTVQASLALAVLSRALVAAGQVDRSEEVRLEALAVLQPLRAAGSSPLRSTLTQGRPR
jgi:predicted ATPase